MTNMTYSEILKECRSLAKEQNITFRRSRTVSLINGKACYDLQSGIQSKNLCRGSLIAVWETLLSENFANQ